MLKILDNNQISPFKETLILYTLSGALVLIGLSWCTMHIPTIINSWKYKNNNH